MVNNTILLIDVVQRHTLGLIIEKSTCSRNKIYVNKEKSDRVS